jgi:hypothetical protein
MDSTRSAGGPCRFWTAPQPSTGSTEYRRSRPSCRSGAVVASGR